MTKMKKLLSIGAVLLAVGATSFTAFAASTYKTPAEAAAGLTGKTTAQVIEERQETGKTYGTIANEAGKLEEFKKENILIKKELLEKRVAAGTLTRERADEIIKALEENAAVCDGTGSAKIGQKYGAGYGSGTCSGTGNGTRLGRQGKMGCSQGTCVTE